MSGITRYAVIETALCIGSNLMEGEVFMVMATDHDRELAALREELESMRDRKSSIVDLQQRLAAAEQRNSETIAKLELAASMMDDDERGNRFAEVCRLAVKSLKPTESGASE